MTMKKVPSYVLELDASLIDKAVISIAQEQYPHGNITQDNAVVSVTKGRAINGRQPELRASITVYPLGKPEVVEEAQTEAAEAVTEEAEVATEEVATDEPATEAKKPLFGAKK